LQGRPRDLNRLNSIEFNLAGQEAQSARLKLKDKISLDESMVSTFWMINALARLISHSGIITVDDFKVQLDEAAKLFAMTNGSRKHVRVFRWAECTEFIRINRRCGLCRCARCIRSVPTDLSRLF